MAYLVFDKNQKERAFICFLGHILFSRPQFMCLLNAVTRNSTTPWFCHVSRCHSFISELIIYISFSSIVFSSKINTFQYTKRSFTFLSMFSDSCVSVISFASVCIVARGGVRNVALFLGWHCLWLPWYAFCSNS